MPSTPSTNASARVAAWAIVVAILVSAINAIIRRIFGVSSNAWLELQWYLFGAVFMLCAAWTLKANEHIRIDIVSNMLSKRGRDWIDVFGHLFFLFPFVALHDLPLRCRISSLLPVRRGLVQCRRPADLARQGAHPPGLHLCSCLQWFSELIKRVAIMRGELRTKRPAATASRPRPSGSSPKSATRQYTWHRRHTSRRRHQLIAMRARVLVFRSFHPWLH